MTTPSAARVPLSVPLAGTTLRGVTIGAGRPALFMHGLGGSVEQAEQLVGPIGGVRWLLPEARGHGASPPGGMRPVSIPELAADALAFAKASGARSMVAGGISLGAAMALHLAACHPGAVRALVLVRPAWLFAPNPPSLAGYAALSAALRAGPAPDARTRLLADPSFRSMAERAPAHAAALLAWFEHPDPAGAAATIDDLLASDPGITASEAAGLEVPTLVLSAAGEEAHPVATAQALADALPRARLVTVPPRGGDKPAFLERLRAAIADFLAKLPADPPN